MVTEDFLWKSSHWQAYITWLSWVFSLTSIHHVTFVKVVPLTSTHHVTFVKVVSLTGIYHVTFVKVFSLTSIHHMTFVKVVPLTSIHHMTFVKVVSLTSIHHVIFVKIVPLTSTHHATFVKIVSLTVTHHTRAHTNFSLYISHFLAELGEVPYNRSPCNATEQPSFVKIGALNVDKIKTLVVSQSLHVYYHCLLHPCKLCLLKTKSTVYGTAYFTTTSLAAQYVFSPAHTKSCKTTVSPNPARAGFRFAFRVKP